MKGISRKMLTPDDRWIKAKRRCAAARQKGLCHWCGLPMNDIPNDPMQASLDHLEPKYLGGVTRPGAYVAAHRKCNSERHPEMNRGKATGSAVVATTGDFDATTSPFAVLRGRIHGNDEEDGPMETTEQAEDLEKARAAALTLANRLDQLMSEAHVPLLVAEMAMVLLVAKLVTVVTERDWRTNLHMFAETVDETLSAQEEAAKCLN